MGELEAGRLLSMVDLLTPWLAAISRQLHWVIPSDSLRRVASMMDATFSEP
jgi:hypothetical protein